MKQLQQLLLYYFSPKFDNFKKDYKKEFVTKHF